MENVIGGKAFLHEYNDKHPTLEAYLNVWSIPAPADLLVNIVNIRARGL